jgi:hypothetical protein
MEFIKGNEERGIRPHPVASQHAMNRLWPGSWINANYDTWIGEREENLAWRYLLRTRRDLAGSGLPQPDPRTDPPRARTKEWYASRAWEEMYAAEGSDWFWWYGDDQTAPGADRPLDAAYLTHLENVYAFARRAGSSIASPGFVPIITLGGAPSSTQGVMAQSTVERQRVVFTCDARAQQVTKAIYIVGNLPAMGAWQPNTVMMRDDGSGGDAKAGDGIWTFVAEVPLKTEVQYKYTNSGTAGQWTPGEEFAARNRTLMIPSATPAPRVITDTFGQ